MMCAVLCYRYDVIRSYDHSTQHRRFPRRTQCRDQTRISLSFHDVITDVITPESTIRVVSNLQHKRPFQKIVQFRGQQL